MVARYECPSRAPPGRICDDTHWVIRESGGSRSPSLAPPPAILPSPGTVFITLGVMRPPLSSPVRHGAHASCVLSFASSRNSHLVPRLPPVSTPRRIGTMRPTFPPPSRGERGHSLRGFAPARIVRSITPSSAPWPHPAAHWDNAPYLSPAVPRGARTFASRLRNLSASFAPTRLHPALEGRKPLAGGGARNEREPPVVK